MVAFAPLLAPLFVPANKPERFAKAAATKADTIIIDLEDAVPTSEKETARKAMIDALKPIEKPFLIRVNSANSPYSQEDIRAASETSAIGLMLPKTESAEQIHTVVRLAKNSDITVIPLIENALGISRLDEICKHSAVDQIAFGSIDYALDIGCEETIEALLHARSSMVFQSRLANIHAPIDGVTTDFLDETKIKTDCAYAKSLGFGGKLLIHPKQVEPTINSFYPSEEEYDWAVRIVQATKDKDGAAVNVDGNMVDLPVILKAERIVRRYNHS